MDKSEQTCSLEVDALHDFDGSRHETDQFSLYQRGSKAFHDPQLAVHAVNNTRLTFLLSVSASVSCTGCHCGVQHMSECKWTILSHLTGFCLV